MANIERRVRDRKVRWYARHYDPSGNRHTKVFDTKAEADRFLTSVEMSKITGSYVDPNRSKVTVGVLADQWLEAKLDLAPKTRDRYEGIIRAHVRPRWGKVRLSDVTHAEVQRWLARLDLAPATVRKVHRVLSMIMAYAMKDGRLAVNPAAGVSLPRVREPEKRYLTDQRVAELADAVGEEAVRNVPVGHLSGGHESLVGDGDAVVCLIPVPQTAKNIDRVGNRRLRHLDRLEAALQGGVHLHILAILVQGRGADGLKLAPGQHWLEDARGIDRAFGSTRSDQGVDLVDEQHDVTPSLDLLQYLLQALLEVAAVTASGDQRAKVQGVDLLVP